MSGPKSYDHVNMVDNDGLMLLRSVRNAYRHLLKAGVTTMRDIGGATQLMKRMVDEGVIIGPRLKIAIAMLSTTGGHADFRGPDRCHAELSRLWPYAVDAHRGIAGADPAYQERTREILARTELWADDFTVVSHWVPQFLWIGEWLRRGRP